MAQNPILDSLNSSTPPKPTGTTVAVPKETTAAPKATANVETDIVNPIIKQAEQFAAKSAVVGRQQQTLIKQQQDVLGSITDAAEQSTKAAVVIETQKNIADLQAQNATISVAKAAGGTEFLTLLAAEQKKAAEEVIRLGNEVEQIRGTERTGIGLIDAVINELASIQEQVQLEGATEEFTRLTNTSQNLGAMTESAARVHAVTKETLNDATIAAAQEKMAADMQIALGETKLKTLRSNADLLQATMDADARVLDAHLTAYKVRNEELNREIRLKEYQISAAAANRAATDWREGREVRFDVIESVKRGQAAAGMPIEDETTIRYGLQQSGDIGERYNTLMQIGVQKTGTLGPTPGDAIINVAKVATAGIADSPEGNIMTAIRNEAVAATARPVNPVPVPKTEADYKVLLNNTAKEKAAALEQEIVTGDVANWYHAPNFSVLATNSRAVKESKLYTDVLQPLKMEEFNPQRLLGAALAGIKSKTVGLEEAVQGVTSVVKAAIAYNNEAKKFSRIGLPDQVSYKVKAEIPGSLFVTRIPVVDWSFKTIDKLSGTELTARTKTIDLADETLVRNLFVKTISVGGQTAESYPLFKSLSEPTPEEQQ